MRIINMFILTGVIITIAITVFSIYKDSYFEEKSILIPIQIETKISEVETNFQKLDHQYCVSYGDEKAPIKIVEFFSFQCPYCVKLFRDDFERIKKQFIDTGMVHFIFHPVPKDVTTVQAIVCLGQLGRLEKRLFLEVMFEEADPSDQDLMSELMVTAMNVFKKPIPLLKDKTFLQNHPVFEKIYHFLQQEKVSAVPSVEINGHLYSEKTPSFQFLNECLKG